MMYYTWNYRNVQCILYNASVMDNALKRYKSINQSDIYKQTI